MSFARCGKWINSWCKDCHKQYKKNNRDKINAHQRNYNHRHRRKVNQNRRERYAMERATLQAVKEMINE